MGLVRLGLDRLASSSSRCLSSTPDLTHPDSNPGPRTRTSTNSPVPVRSSSAMTPAPTAHGPLRMSRRAVPGQAGPGRAALPDFRTSICNLRRAAKADKTAASSRGCAERRGPGKHCRTRTQPRHRTPAADVLSRGRYLNPTHTDSPGPAPPEPGHHPMRQWKPRRRVKVRIYLSRSSAPVLRSGPNCTGTVSSAAASESPSRCCGRSRSSNSRLSLRCGSLSLLLRQLVHHSPQARSPGSRRAHAPHVPGPKRQVAGPGGGRRQEEDRR